MSKCDRGWSVPCNACHLPKFSHRLIDYNAQLATYGLCPRDSSVVPLTAKLATAASGPRRLCRCDAGVTASCGGVGSAAGHGQPHPRATPYRSAMTASLRFNGTALALTPSIPPVRAKRIPSGPRRKESMPVATHSRSISVAVIEVGRPFDGVASADTGTPAAAATLASAVAMATGAGFRGAVVSIP